MTLACVVCGGPVGDEALYANTWERARRRYPCCSSACCAGFDADIHWLPAVRPEAASEDEQRRLLSVARARLENGDNPLVIVRELLLAGVAISPLKKLLGMAHAGSDASRRDSRQRTVFGVLAGLFTGSFGVAVNRDRRSPEALEEALGDLERWERHWDARAKPLL